MNNKSFFLVLVIEISLLSLFSIFILPKGSNTVYQSSDSFIEFTDETELFNIADNVLVGTYLDSVVRNIDISSDNEPECILEYHVLRFKVKQDIKGVAGSDIIEVKIMEDQLNLEAGCDYKLFLTAFSDVPYSLVNPHQSVIPETVR